MISLNTNYGGLFASKAASQAQRGLDTAMERLSSGMRINYAKDDAAGQAIATRLTAEVQGLEMASRNASDAQALIDTAEGALQESHNLLLRMRELAVQSANGTMSSDDLDATDAEYQQMIAELDRVSDTTAWAGTKLLNASSTLTFQVGADGTSDHRISLSLSNMDSASLGLGSHSRGPDNVADTQFDGDGASLDADGAVNQDSDGNNILLGDDAAMAASDLQSQSNAQDALARIDAAIKMVSTTRASFGAASNRLSSTITNLDQITVNLDASKGRIQDADFAAETSNLAKSQILQQAATAMLAQANASKQTVLALVR